MFIQTSAATWKPFRLDVTSWSASPRGSLSARPTPGLPLSSWMRVCSFSLHRVTGQTKCHMPLSHVLSFPGTIPTLQLISDPPSGKDKWQLTAIDGWGLRLHLSTDKCFNLSVLRNHINWRDFVLFLGSANRKGESCFNIFLPRAQFYCTLSEKAFLFKAQGK